MMEQDYLDQYHRVRDEVAEHDGSAWGTMIYACADEARGESPTPPGWERIAANWPDDQDMPETVERHGRTYFAAKPAGCGYEERYWLGFGVEGPSDLRARELTIPSPFVCGTCPRCGLPMQHVRWRDDETFGEPRAIPDGARRFVVPDADRAAILAGMGYGGGDFIDPGSNGGGA